MDEAEAGRRLKQIIDERKGVVPDAASLGGLLRDYFPGEPGDVSVLLAAVSEGIPNRLQGESGIPGLVLRSHLEDLLSRNRRIDRGAARWAVSVWATALNIKPEPPGGAAQIPEGEGDARERPSGGLEMVDGPVPREIVERPALSEEKVQKPADTIPAPPQGKTRGWRPAALTAAVILALATGTWAVARQDPSVSAGGFREGGAYRQPGWYTFSNGWRVTSDADMCWTVPPEAGQASGLMIGIGRKAGPLLAFKSVSAAKLPAAGFDVRIGIPGGNTESQVFSGVKAGADTIAMQAAGDAFFAGLEQGTRMRAEIAAADLRFEWPLSAPFSLTSPATWDRAFVEPRPSDAFRAWQRVRDCASDNGLPLKTPSPPPPTPPHDQNQKVEPPPTPPHDQTVGPGPTPPEPPPTDKDPQKQQAAVIVPPKPPTDETTPVVVPPRPPPPPAPSHPAFRGRVTAVFDANAIEIAGFHQPVNLDGILPADPAYIPMVAGELGRYLTGIVVSCYVRPKSRYMCVDAQNRDIAEMAVQRGLARADDERYSAAQQHAQASRLGIWRYQ